MKWTHHNSDGRDYWTVRAGHAIVTVHRLSVHHPLAHGLGWWLTSASAGMECVPLKAEDIESAKREAVELVKSRISEALEQLEREVG